MSRSAYKRVFNKKKFKQTNKKKTQNQNLVWCSTKSNTCNLNGNCTLFTVRSGSSTKTWLHAFSLFSISKSSANHLELDISSLYVSFLIFCTEACTQLNNATNITTWNRQSYRLIVFGFNFILCSTFLTLFVELFRAYFLKWKSFILTAAKEAWRRLRCPM